MSLKCKAYSITTDGSEPDGYKAGFYKGWDAALGANITDDLVWITREEAKYYSDLEAVIDNMPIDINEFIESTS